MRIDSLLLENFRSYARADVSFDSSCNVICGENAQGKTNLLEAIVYLSCARSPRSRSDRELIRFDAVQSFIKGGIFSRGRDFCVEVDLFTARRRRMKVNGVAVKTAAELSSIFNTVFFCPEDLHLIREGAAARRKFMDAALCQLRPRYAAAHAEYARAYEHKTRILRDSEEHPSLLEALPEFNEQLIRAGAVIIHYRAQFCRRLAEYAAAAHFDCSGGREKLNLSYQTVKTIEDPFADVSQIEAALRAHQASHDAAERASRLCLSGPHKDDIIVTINEKEAKAFSSQGQTRTAALSMKLAEREIFKNVTGEYPVLLLDDVLSELDPRRQEFVLNRIGGGQVFITCCEDDRLAALTGGRVFTVQNGEVF